MYQDLIYQYVQVKGYSCFEDMNELEQQSLLCAVANDRYKELIFAKEPEEVEAFFKFAAQLHLNDELALSDADLYWCESEVKGNYLSAINQYFYQYYEEMYPKEFRYSLGMHYADPVESDRAEMARESRF